LRTRIRKNDDITALSKGSENKSTARSLNLSLIDDDVSGASISTAGEGTPSFVPIAVILKMLNGDSINPRFIELVLDDLCERLDGLVELDDDEYNKSEIVKFWVFIDDVPEDDGVCRNWSDIDFDSEDEGCSDDDDGDLEVDGSGKDDFG